MSEYLHSSIPLKKYINIFKKQLSLVPFYFPFSWTINLIKESSNDHH